MNIEQRTAGIARGPAHNLVENELTYIVSRDGKILCLPEHRHISDNEVKLGQIVVGPGGAKLQAFQILHILPGHSQANLSSQDPRGDRYQLEPASSDRFEILILRHGDIITSPDAIHSLACVSRASVVQVNSSATEHAQDEARGETFKEANGVLEVPEEETEDEAAPNGTVTEVPVTQTVTQPSKSQLSATPHLPREKSLVVHETPTTSRMVGVDEYEVGPPNEDHNFAPTPQEIIAATETFSTARTGHSSTSIAPGSTHAGPAIERKRPQGSPKVRIHSQRGKKRASTELSPDYEAELSTEGRSLKRTKKAISQNDGGDDIHRASSLDHIHADTSRTTYSIKRKNQSKPVSVATPTKSLRSSQRSGTATTAAAYEGDPPQVATSNSAIKEGSTAVKFLRKHGGAYLSSVDDRCNVLCVRDGELVKTMKIFQAIALGIPVVTDKWLFDSAKAGDFLDLSSYKPSITQQEEEWNFSLDRVWGTAQTPFKGYCIYFTPALRRTYTNFREIERVCQTVGAEVSVKRTNKNRTTIVLAKEEDDPDVAKIVEDGEICYHKDLLTTSILRGKLDLDDYEFKIRAKRAAELRRKGPRKST
ncbi:hypothetical protein SVAN01_01301 [Stagonosporopsis vannaccii]|nr:hypothetical protein SVAN01_01301 [Stagonosporopsis vannaccii]